MKRVLVVALMLGSVTSMANYSLSFNGKKVTCFGEDNLSLVLNAQRTTISLTVEGEGQGPQRITQIKSDNKNKISYTTSEGRLVLSNTEDTFLFKGEDSPYSLKCR